MMSSVRTSGSHIHDTCIQRPRGLATASFPQQNSAPSTVWTPPDLQRWVLEAPMTPLTGANRESASADLHTGVQARVYRFLKIARDKDRPENFPPTESREGGGGGRKRRRSRVYAFRLCHRLFITQVTPRQSPLSGRHLWSFGESGQSANICGG